VGQERLLDQKACCKEFGPEKNFGPKINGKRESLGSRLGFEIFIQ
jgi:hypothetical protein